MLAQLSNEHIPRVFDRFSEQNRHYLVMEYVEGIHARRRTQKQRRQTRRGARHRNRAAGARHAAVPAQPPTVGGIPRSETVERDAGAQWAGQADRFRHRSIFPAAKQRHHDRHAGLCAAGAVSRTRRGALGFVCARRHDASCAVGTRSRRPSRHSVFRSSATLCPDITPALADLVDQALEYDVVHRMADAREFKERLLAIKSGVATAKVNGADARAAPFGQTADAIAAGWCDSAPRSSARRCDRHFAPRRYGE